MLGYFLSDGDMDSRTVETLEKAIKKAGLVQMMRQVHPKSGTPFYRLQWVDPNKKEPGDMTLYEYEEKKRADRKAQQAKPDEKPKQPDTKIGATEEKTPKKVEEEKKEASTRKADTDLSATGANSWIPVWRGRNLDTHFGGGGKSDHKRHYPNWTKEQYAKRAVELARMPVGGKLLGFKAQKPENGEWYIVRYDTETHDFVKSYHNGPATLFPPDKGKDYYEYQKKAFGGNTDD